MITSVAPISHPFRYKPNTNVALRAALKHDHHSSDGRLNRAGICNVVSADGDGSARI